MNWIRSHIKGAGTKLSIEGSFSLPIILIAPDATIISVNEDGDQLRGQVLYDSDNQIPESGDDLVAKEDRITLRKSAIEWAHPVPKAGETWQVKYPLDPQNETVLTNDRFTTKDKAPIDGDSIGFITLFPKQAKQSL